ncbi:hypothetical protein [Streptacidiphilus cavernicola]|uniref:Secreted protein n=1 Tax=Streptacidiphilus cavernicola TaxID=3342716 RepID=A0ABV6VRD8_9ACTN
MRTNIRRTTTALTVTGVALGALLLGDGTAFAKSTIGLTVSSHSLRVGQSVRVTGSGGDDSVLYTYTCVDSRVGSGSWHAVSCSSKPYRSVTVSVRATRRGTLSFRTRLLGARSTTGPRRLDRVSAPTTVVVH